LVRDISKSQYYYFDDITSDFIIPDYLDSFSILNYDPINNEIGHKQALAISKKYCPSSSEIKTKSFIFSPNEWSMDQVIDFGGCTEYF
jgi:hypothetical protein